MYLAAQQKIEDYKLILMWSLNFSDRLMVMFKEQSMKA